MENDQSEIVTMSSTVSNMSEENGAREPYPVASAA